MSNQDLTNQESAYIEGRAVAHRRAMLYHARELGIFHADDPLVALAHTNDQLARTRKQLMELSKRLGCNDWDDSLDLGDVVDHLLKSLDSTSPVKEPPTKELILDWIRMGHCRAEDKAHAKQKPIWQSDLDDASADYIAEQLAKLQTEG